MRLKRRTIKVLTLPMLIALVFHFLPPTGYKPVYHGSEEQRLGSCSKWVSSPHSVAISHYRSDPYEWLADLTVSGPKPGRKRTYIVVVLRTLNEHRVRFGPEIKISKHFGMTNRTIEMRQPTTERELHYKRLSFVVQLGERPLNSILVQLPEIIVDGEPWGVAPFAIRPLRDYLGLLTHFDEVC